MELQEVLFELEMDYAGHPYYVSGNAIMHALADELPYREQQGLRASHGVFVPQNFGRYPEWHSQTGTAPGFGSSLKPVEAYHDLFLYRLPHCPWLLDSRPRDVLSCPDVKVHSDRPILSHRSAVNQQHTWYIHAYLHDDGTGVVPLDDSTLDGLQFGGARNYGYGTTRLKESRTVDTDGLRFDVIDDAGDHLLELVSPYVLSSELPQTDDSPVPSWWRSDAQLRRRTEAVVQQRERHHVETVDHGQVVGYDGDRPVETAANGIQRIGTHSKYGFGEFVLWPVDSAGP